MRLASVCPSCGAAGIRHSQKFVAMWDGLVPAQCDRCGAFCVPKSAVEPGALVFMPEAIAGPVVLLLWWITKDARLSCQIGLSALVLFIAIEVQRARLVAFVPENAPRLRPRRRWMLAGAVVVLAICYLFTLLVPGSES